jgi:formylglycine-generating enzyme required for sulfatase activity
MVKISWKEANEYCRWAGGRLPTEAEWEYVARAGRDDASTFPNAGRNLIYRNDEMPASKAFGKNAFGVFDMGGIIWEWCADWFGPEYYGRSSAADPRGPLAALPNGAHVRRGGAYAETPDKLRISRRDSWHGLDNKTGFRCVLDNLPDR